MAREPDTIEAEIVGSLTLIELSRCSAVPVDWIVDLVEHGVLDPKGGTSRDWRFESHSLSLVIRARRLQTDLGLNLEGIALALNLLEENAALRRRLHALQAGAVDQGQGPGLPPMR